MRKILLIYLVSVFVSANLFAGDNNWEIETENQIHWLKTFHDSLIIVASKNKISAIQTATGETAWELQDFKDADKSIYASIESSDRAIIFQYERNFPNHDDPIRNKILPSLIDVPTGEILLNNESMGIYHSLGMYKMPNNNFLLYAYNVKEKISIRALDVQNGKIIWVDSVSYMDDKPKILNHEQSENVTLRTIIGNQPPVFDTDSTMIILDNKKYVRKWNINTGKILWAVEYKQKRYALLRDDFAFAKLNEENTVLYMVLNNSLCAVDVNNGSIIWQTIDLNKRIKQIIQNEDFIILKLIGFKKGNRYLYLSKIDKRTGEVIYVTDKICNKNNNLQLEWQDNKIVFYSDNFIYTFDHEKNISERIPQKIKLKHGDALQKFTIINDDYYLQSSQNLMCLNKMGNIIFHTEVQPPDLTFTQSLTLLATLALDIYASTLTPFYLPSNIKVPELKNSTNKNFYMYMLKNNVIQGDSKCNGIARINYFTGELESEICVYTNTPIYVVDETNNCIYYVKDKKNIVSQNW